MQFQDLKNAMKRFSEDGASQSAAALAFYAVTALPPLLVILVSLLSFAFSTDQATEHLLSQVEAFTGEATREFTAGLLENRQNDRNGVAALFGFVLVLVGASAFFAQLQAVLNRIWGAEGEGGIKATVLKRLLGMAAVLGVGLLLLVSVVASAVLSAVSDYLWSTSGWGAPLLVTMEGLLTVLFMACAFAMVIYLLPDCDVSVKPAFVGATAAAILFSVGKVGMGWHLGRADFTADYGSAGALVLLLFWVYYSAMIFLYGAELARVLDKDRNQSCT